MECMDVGSGCGCKRYKKCLILFIAIHSSGIYSFLAASSLLFVHFVKSFAFLFVIFVQFSSN